MALTGDLSEIDLNTVLKLISDTKGTGKITFEVDSLKIILYFKNGKLVNAEGAKDPISSVEKLLSCNKGKFEFVKLDSVNESPDAQKLQDSITKAREINENWSFVRSKFPNLNLKIDISEAKGGEEVKVTGEEWKILSLIREPVPIANIVANSPFGELKTLLTLADLFEKKLITIKIEEEDKLLPDDNVIPFKEAGWYALNAPIYGEKNIEFYKRIDGRKDFPTIVKEIGISYKEGREILKYLVSQGKISIRKKTR